MVESELLDMRRALFLEHTPKKMVPFIKRIEEHYFWMSCGTAIAVQKLRVLESGEIRRVGAQKPEFPDVRIVAATNRDLSSMVREESISVRICCFVYKF